MDEFQDTTDSQYDLVQAAFQQSTAVVTAVGDSKQRIMTWAGAMVDAFDRFTSAFVADRSELLRNYRSSPELVRIQHFIARAIEAASPPAEAARVDDGNSSCSVLEFTNPEQEAEYLAQMIADGIHNQELKPRDFCVLARQRTAAIIQPLQTALAKRGIRLRDESTLQDMLAEPVTAIILALLRLATRERDPEAWELLTDELARLHGEEPGHSGAMSGPEATRLLLWSKEVITKGTVAIADIPHQLVQQIGEDNIRSTYRQYRAGPFLQQLAQGIGKELHARAAMTIRDAIDDLIGTDIVPAMTVHKSKGLEFETVIFLGLEDSQLWNFANQSDEEIRGFFVAFSRAIRHVYFTFSDVRDGQHGRQAQAKSQIKDLYEILQAAGVPTLDCRQAAS
jgi:superfamily I DNA/RNA helicase